MDSRSYPFTAPKRLIKSKRPRREVKAPKDGGAKIASSWNKNYLQSNDKRAYDFVNSKRFPIDLSGMNFAQRDRYVQAYRKMLDNEDQKIAKALVAICG